MGVIRKKTASRGTEAGTKFHCDVCSIDVTSTVRTPTMSVYHPEANVDPSIRFASRVHIPPVPNMTSVSPASPPEKARKTTTPLHIHSK
jgi:hypothetical protein